MAEARSENGTAPKTSLFGPRDEERPGGISPDDFALALQRTVDDLQTRLSVLTNPITDFAVKTFRLEVPVVLSVTRLGTVSYRLVSPGDTVDPAAVSKIELTLTPIEKRPAEGSLPAQFFKLDSSLEELTGLDDRAAATLREHQIHTAGDLWRVGSRASARVQLASLLEMNRETLSNLISQAELLLLKGAGKVEVRALRKAGISTLADLCRLGVSELIEKYGRAVAGSAPALTEAQATSWIDAARSYLGLSKLEEAD